MDMIYQAVKSFFKSFVNLLVAMIELLTALINGLASILKWVSPHISEGYSEIRRDREGLIEKGKWHIKGKKAGVLDWEAGEDELVQKMRQQLHERVKSRDQYLFLYARTSDPGTGFWVIVLSLLALVLAGGIVLVGGNSQMEYRIWVLIIMALVCGAVCIAVNRHQERVAENRLIRQILEEEFRDQAWEKEVKAAVEEEKETVAEVVEEEKED